MNARCISITLLVLLLNQVLAPAQTPIASADRVPAGRKTASAVTPATYTGRQVMVGSGGGFTGASTTYYLLDNGQLFGRRSSDSLYTSLGRQTATATKRVFTTVEKTCKIKTTKFNKPGNLYTFVQWRKGKETYRVAWGAPGTTVPERYPTFYRSFLKMIPVSVQLK
ncbi:FAD-binding oxidoreductase [Spirosoma knui]